VAQHEHREVRIRCPHCGYLGIFEILPIHDIWIPDEGKLLGQRRCPNLECRGHVFFIRSQASERLITYPPEKIDFKKDGIPSNIVSIFEEAITCQANGCYIASAMLIRKTLEELCKARGANGSNLFNRIEALKNSIVIPKELMDALHELRLLGNDATHVEAEVYDKIGEEETSIAITLTKELLKALYQYTDLLGQLTQLKKMNNP
jgi:hypothetical protein